MKYIASSASALALVIGAGMAAPAMAQSNTQDDAVSLGEVVVTAQRREQSLQEVPLAITAFGSEALERTAATGIQDVAGKVPGVTLTQFNIGEPQIFIRGVGTTSDSAASDPSIGVSIDEVSIGRSGGSSLGFLDIERVEVLRGPQGTLYGRNASGGAMNVYTKRPRFENSGQITARAGSFEEFGVEGYLNGQMGEDTAGRVAFRWNTNDGYAKNIDTGGSLEGGDQFGLRAQILHTAGDWAFLGGIDYSKDEMQGHARIPVTASSTPAAFVALINNIRGDMTVRESFSSADNYQNRENWGLTGRIEYAGHQNFDFVSLTSYRSNDYEWRDNLGGIPFPAFPLAVDNAANEAATQFSQEFRLTSKAGSRINWVAGLYYFQEDVDRTEYYLVQTALPIAPPSFGGDTKFDQVASNTSYAVFGQATIPFAEIWELTVGARWTHDDREVHQVAIDRDPLLPVGIPLGPTGAPYDVKANTSFEEPTWKLALSVEPVDNVRFYASYDRGYKAGAYSAGAQTDLQAQTPLKSEILDNYELGAKTTLANGRLRLNAAAFKLDYNDLQVYELAGLVLVTSNAEAEVSGFEIETAFAVNHNLTIGGSYTSLDAKYTSDATAFGATLPYKGNVMPRSPESQFTLYADGQWDAFGGILSARADYQWTNDFYFDPSNAAEVRVPAYGLISAFASWENANGFKVSVYGKNLGDEEYRQHVIKNANIGFSVFGAPRSFGIALSKSF
ncbi:TonB-dependent receptor [uncultured Brevundimonas sp.]|uniref:TonB-dependent receptor n=1 Tax=uncultured Brevundimonas sp. TaxID=213418 RepID=UPI00261D9857|nr:TonB-dependent receptor [uncultured Brevundimonas sp.]